MKISQIKDVLVSFLQNKSNDAAILIDGPWGCGKTFAINNIIKDLEEQERKIITYVSLFGIKNIEEITSQISTKLSNGVKSILNILASATKGVPYCGESISGTLDNVLGKLEKTNYVKSESIIIFDDLERTDDEFSFLEFLGIINNLIAKKCKILCIYSKTNLSESKIKKIEDFSEKVFDKIYIIDEKQTEIIREKIQKEGINIPDSELNNFSFNIRNVERAISIYKSLEKVISENNLSIMEIYPKIDVFICSYLAICIQFEKNTFVFDKTKDSFESLEFEEIEKVYGNRIANNYYYKFKVKKLFQAHGNEPLQKLIGPILKYVVFNNKSNLIDLFPKSSDSILNKSYILLNDSDRKKYKEAVLSLLKSTKTPNNYLIKTILTCLEVDEKFLSYRELDIFIASMFNDFPSSKAIKEYEDISVFVSLSPSKKIKYISSKIEKLKSTKLLAYYVPLFDKLIVAKDYAGLYNLLENENLFTEAKNNLKISKTIFDKILKDIKLEETFIGDQFMCYKFLFVNATYFKQKKLLEQYLKQEKKKKSYSSSAKQKLGIFEQSLF